MSGELLGQEFSDYGLSSGPWLSVQQYPVDNARQSIYRGAAQYLHPRNFPTKPGLIILTIWVGRGSSV